MAWWSTPGFPNAGLVTGLSVGLGSLMGTVLGAATGRWGLQMPLWIGFGALVVILFRFWAEHRADDPSGHAR